MVPMLRSPVPLETGPAARPGAVLFVCDRNSVRSPMAEGILKHLRGGSIYVDSCGVDRGRADPFAQQVLVEIGIDLSRHRSKSLEDLDDGFFDLVIALSGPARLAAERLALGSACEVEFWPMPDATAADGHRDARLAAYREVRDALLTAIRRRFPAGDGGPPPAGPAEQSP